MSAIHNAIMRDLQRPLGESFDKTHASFKWDRKTDTNWTGFFTINKKKFRLNVNTTPKKGSTNHWTADFGTNLSPEEMLLGAVVVGGAAITVLATVVNALVEFVKAKGPAMLTFVSKLGKKHKDLYKKIAEKLSEKIKELGYKVKPVKAKDVITVTKIKTKPKRNVKGVIVTEEFDDTDEDALVFEQEEKLDEAFDFAYPYNWTRDYEMMKEAQFRDASRTLFNVSFIKTSLTFWSVAYGSKADGKPASVEPTGESGSSSIKILSTVLVILKDFIKNEQPEAFWFTGAHGSGLSDLYTRMMKKFAPTLVSMGYDVEETPYGTDTEWKITRRP